MPEQKQGFFPWKIEQLLSVVPDFAQDIIERQQPKGVPPSEKREPSLQGDNAKRDSEPELVAETKTSIVEVPKEVIDRFRSGNTEEDWEVLSGKMSNRSLGGEIVVPRAGSVRSIDHENSSQTTLSLPFKIQRTSSSSTLDSQDNILGPSGKGVLGVDYVEHVVLPTDTLQGVCLAYKALRTGFIRVQDTDTKEYKLSYFQAEFPDISATEARAYLELADWELKEALQSAKEDREWEQEEAQGEELKSGQIGVRINFTGGKPLMNLKGIGQSTKNALIGKKMEDSEKDKSHSSPPKQKVVVYTTPPAIATKTVMAQDLFDAAPQHNSFGFELKPLPKRSPSPESS